MFLLVACQHASGTCKSHFCLELSLREVLRKYVELSPNTEKDLTPTPNLLQIQPIPPPLRHILSVTLMLTQPMPLLSRCHSQHQAAAAVPPPSCHCKAAITAAAAVALFQCCHCCRCHHCCATAAAIKLPPPHRRQALDVAATAVGLLQCCYCHCCHCCRTAAAATKLPPPSCRRQAAAAAAAKLLLLPRRHQAAATVTTTITHAEIKHYMYVGIHNEYTLASTVIGTIRNYKT
jgi:hypothetical protein